MSVRTLFRTVTDSGAPQRHYECQRCGKNLTNEHESCPNCGGRVAVYDL